MRKVNPFVILNQYHYQDEEHSFWVLEHDLEEFKEQWKDALANGMKLIKQDTIKGNVFNSSIIGNIVGEYEGFIIDLECPACEALLVDYHGDGYYCTECDYENEQLVQSQLEERERINNYTPPPKMKEAGQTLEEFVTKYGFSKEVFTPKQCVKCKLNINKPTDFYRIKGYAIITWEHGDCTNKGPSCAIPLGDEVNKWLDLL